MDIQGYCYISKNATTCKGAKNPSDFIGERCRVISFGVDDSVLVVNPKGTAAAMFDKEDVLTSFKCGFSGEVVTPPDLSIVEQMHYATRALTRKGGYNDLLRNMVIEASLHKGKFEDGFLWALQPTS